MKLKNIFLVAFAAVLAMAGCTKPIDFGDPDIKVTPGTVEVPMAGGSVTVTVTTTRAWKLKDLPEWIVAEPDHGPASFEPQQITLTFLENTKGNRYASIKFFAGIVSEFADISQPGPKGETGGIDDLTIKEFLEKADPNTAYRLTGTVSSFNPNYCSFDLTDESGSTVYVYSVDEASKAEFAEQIKSGGTVTLTGKYYYYQNSSDPSKNKVEINSAHIEKYVAPTPVDPSTIEQITVAEFIQKADPNTTYRLVGKVVNFNSTYVSFNVDDGTGSVYVYSLNAESKAEYASKIKNGGTITITGNYYYYKHATDDSKSKVEIMEANVEEYKDSTPVDPTTIEQITVAEFLQKADPNTTYRLVGKVKSFNSQYCSFDLDDGTGSVYIYKCDDASKAEYASKIKDGGTITITGNYYYYTNSDPSKNKVEINPATIEKYEDPTPVDPTQIEQITVAEFLQKADPNTTYRLVGKVKNFNSQYCSFDLEDSTGSVYIYKCDDASKAAYGSKIKDGGTVTLTGKYYYYTNSDPAKCKVEINPATIEKYEDGSDPGPDPAQIEQITVAEFLQKADPNTTYRLVGKVKNFNSQYCSFDLEDSTGSVYIYKCDDASKAAYGSKIKDGGTVTLTGKYYYYTNSDPAKCKVEINPATIEKYEDGTDPGPGPVDPDPTIETVSVAVFLRYADPNTTYRLQGEVSNFNSQYCSFTLTDNTGSIYIYSLDAASKSTYASQIKDGGAVSLTGKYYYYNNTSDPSKSMAEVKDAHVEQYIPGQTPIVPPSGGGDSVTLSFPDDNSANNAGSGYGLSWVAKSGNYSFDIVNFNNNKWANNWTFIKCGHKSTAYKSSIANSTAIPATIDKVVVSIDRVLDASKVTAFALQVATDANFTTVTETIQGTMAQGDQTFNIANPIANGYYKIIINCDALGGSTNGGVTVTKVLYSAKASIIVN